MGDVAQAMGNDIRQAWVNNKLRDGGHRPRREGDWHVDDWGIRWVKRGAFNQSRVFRSSRPTGRRCWTIAFLRTGSRLSWRRWRRWSRCKTTSSSAAISPPGVRDVLAAARMENAMLDMAGDPELAGEMFRRCADFAVRLGELACDRFPLDWLWTGDGRAGQQSMLMSPALWGGSSSPTSSASSMSARNGACPWLITVAEPCGRSFRPDRDGTGRTEPDSGQLPGDGRVGTQEGFRQGTDVMGGSTPRGPSER